MESAPKGMKFRDVEVLSPAEIMEGIKDEASVADELIQWGQATDFSTRAWRTLAEVYPQYIAQAGEFKKIWGALSEVRKRAEKLEGQPLLSITPTPPPYTRPADERVVIELRCRGREFNGVKYGQITTAVDFQVVEGAHAQARAEALGVYEMKPNSMAKFWASIGRPSVGLCPPSAGHWRWTGKAKPCSNSRGWVLHSGTWEEIVTDTD